MLTSCFWPVGRGWHTLRELTHTQEEHANTTQKGPSWDVPHWLLLNYISCCINAPIFLFPMGGVLLWKFIWLVENFSWNSTRKGPWFPLICLSHWEGYLASLRSHYGYNVSTSSASIFICHQSHISMIMEGRNGLNFLCLVLSTLCRGSRCSCSTFMVSFFNSSGIWGNISGSCRCHGYSS